MINITTGQEMKLSVLSTDTLVNSKTKSIRYVDPLAGNSTDANLTALARDLYKNSTNTYKATKGTIELGYLSET